MYLKCLAHLERLLLSEECTVTTMSQHSFTSANNIINLCNIQNPKLSVNCFSGWNHMFVLTVFSFMWTELTYNCNGCVFFSISKYMYTKSHKQTAITLTLYKYTELTSIWCPLTLAYCFYPPLHGSSIWSKAKINMLYPVLLKDSV